MPKKSKIILLGTGVVVLTSSFLIFKITKKFKGKDKTKFTKKDLKELERLALEMYGVKKKK